MPVSLHARGFAPTVAQLARRARDAWRAGWLAWWLGRLPRTDTWALGQSNIYIVPTKAGWTFAATLLVMLFASINYQLNLGYVLTFLLTGCALVSIHLTHGNLRGLTLRLRVGAPGFAREPATLEVVLTNPGARPRRGIALSVQTPETRDRQAWCDVPALGQTVSALSFVPSQRGLHEVPVLRAETRFPLGLFRAWTLWRPLSQVLAWPAPERPAAPLPAPQAQDGDGADRRVRDGGEFEGVRAYRRGDPLRRVVWKKVARTGELVTRDTSTSASAQLWLDWQAAAAAGNTSAEARLSRLTAWVLAAEATGAMHGLRLPGTELSPSHGDAHRRRALDALALWA